MSAPAPLDTSAHGRFVPGRIVSGRYRIVSMLGKGGMGEVYRADDLTLGQPVALKFLPEGLTRNEDALRRFRNEVRIARQVSHPNVCRVHDVGEVEGQVYLTMEYVDGEDLASLLRRIGRLPEDKAVEIARKLCAGLAAAHEKGVLHRDLKPGNVMLDSRGQVLLTDFGLAGLSQEIAGAEVRSGTPAYMAPEQMAGREVTARSDIYSLGLVLYELFTGKRPFEGNSLAELMRARMETTPISLSSVIRDLDPTVERVILRCLSPDPSARPSSALAVAAALPGGDPLAAALAAGETPSPQLVAAAGEGAGLSLRVALPLLVVVIIGILGFAVLEYRVSAFEHMGTRYSPEVLEHRARQLIQSFGYTADAADRERGMYWDQDYVGWVSKNDKPDPKWWEVLRARVPVLHFWYRQSEYPLLGMQFHDDLLTPGVVTPRDPEPTMSGMIAVELDAEGRLLQFRRMPEQKQDKPGAPAPVDWSRFFEAAGIDRAQLQPAEPQWAWLESSDTRSAWTGKWPGTDRPLRVEAAAFAGKPVVFAVLGPWSAADRMPDTSWSLSSSIRPLILITIVIVVMSASAVLAHRNYVRGRGDRRGATRLAAFMFVVQICLWIARVHPSPYVGFFAALLIGVATAVFYGAVVWLMYMALEPYVRRRWPQTIISWTRVLSGRIRDPIVARDILIGAAVSLCWRACEQVARAIPGVGSRPDFVSVELFEGFRSALGERIENVPHAVRETLIFFVLLFLLRVLLRNQWVAAAAFVSIFAVFATQQGGGPAMLAINAFMYAVVAVVILRFGLLALAAGILIDGSIGDIPVTFDPSAWYFGTFVFTFAAVLLVVIWAFRQATAGQRLLASDIFD